MSNFSVLISKQAKKYLDANKRLKKAFDEWQPSLSENPHDAHDGMLIGEKKDGLQVYKKALVGKKYRALFTIDDESISVLIFKVNSRGDVYKK
jgi:mRNA-degrading endonuclease RelE of RelBE toxin-antitoxin system